jgi:resuscitation-promoting factor RpfB
VRKKIGIIAAVMVATLSVIGAGFAYASKNKTVTLSVDGKVTEVDTSGATVGEVLQEEGIPIDRHDAVAPSLSSTIEEGSRIAVRFGRQLTLKVDGNRDTYWVTADSVNEALGQLGFRFADADLSASRGMPIGRQGLNLVVQTEKTVTFVDGGQKPRKVSTTAVTVQQALKELKATLNKHDKVKPRSAAEIDDGSRIVVTRVGKFEDTKRVDIDPRTVVRHNDDMLEGHEKVIRPGRDGVNLVTFQYIKVNGKRVGSNVLRHKVVREPVSRIVVHGTEEPEPQPSVPTGTIWDQLAECESGGDWSTDTGNGYYGGLQFSDSTWDAYGGEQYAATADEATREEQIAIGRKVQAAQGWDAWPSCAAELGLI